MKKIIKLVLIGLFLFVSTSFADKYRTYFIRTWYPTGIVDVKVDNMFDVFSRWSLCYKNWKTIDGRWMNVINIYTEGINDKGQQKLVVWLKPGFERQK